MMPAPRIWLAGVVMSMCVAATPPPDRGEALRNLVALDLRVAVIGNRLAVANVSDCVRRTPQSGLVMQDLVQFRGADRAAAIQTFGLSDWPMVSAIVPGSVADQAGLRAGDRISAVGESPVATADLREPYARIAAIEAAIEAGPTVLTVESNVRKPARVLIAGTPGCAVRVQVIPGRKLNAWTDGNTVQLTDAVVNFASDDNEVAAIVAHEMAHAILGHAERLEREGRKTAAIRATEVEADAKSLTLMKRAGYDPKAAARFWQRFGKRTGYGIFSDRTHPRTAERVAALAAEAERLMQ